MMNPKLIMLDFDGVIVDGSNQGYFACFHQALESVDVALSVEEEHARLVQGWGGGHIEQLKILLAEHPDRVERAGKTWMNCVDSDDFWHQVRVIDRTQEALEKLSQKATVIIVSGSEKKFIERILKRDGLTGISAVYSSYDVVGDLKKPNPHTLEIALQNFGVDPSEAIYVGDMENDVVMARAAGVEPMIVLTGDLDQARSEATGVTVIQKDLFTLSQMLFP